MQAYVELAVLLALAATISTGYDSGVESPLCGGFGRVPKSSAIRTRVLRSRTMADMTYPAYWMYKDNQQKWRWTYYAVNGEEIAVSSESYNRRADCQRSVEIMKASANTQVWMPEELLNAQ
jgi:uncharacterized protein